MQSSEQNSLEERRKRNIERNQIFLRDLLAANEHPSESSGGNDVSEGVMFSPKKLCKREETSDDLQTVLHQFPCRDIQIQKLYQTLNHHLKKAYLSQSRGQCVILYGPSGCGKFSVLTKLLDLESCCTIAINCKFLTSFPDLMQNLYIETVNKLQLASTWSHKLKHYRDLNCRCVDIADYISFLQKYLLDDEVSNDLTRKSSNIVVVFRNFDHLLAESKLLTALPQIPQFASISIHIVFSLSSIPSNYGDAPYYHQLIHFPAYREEELKSITKFLFKRDCENFVDELLANNQNQSKETTDTAVFPKEIFLAWMNDEIISSYDRLCDYTVPFVKSFGIHKIPHLQKILYAMWIKLFFQKDAEIMLEQTYAQILQTLSSNSIKSSSSIDIGEFCLKKLQRPNQSQFKIILEELLKKPYETHTTILPRHINGNNNLKTLASSLAQGSYHTQSIPIDYRRIIIACYIASQNPRQYDELAFMIENKQKRRKPRIPSQPKEKQSGENVPDKNVRGDEGNKSAELVSTSIADAINTNYRIISLERILSIYSHIVLHTTKRKPGIADATIEINFANPLLSGFIGQMVKEHLLYPASNWMLSAPQYIANISSQYAQEIAKSLDFPLQHFLLHGQSGGYQWVW